MVALYRKYRSKTLDEIIGQDHIVKLLSQSLKLKRIAHAYLLTGPRGVGKTSVARILAHAINELPYSDESAHLDIIEIDAASNNSVDDIRDLRDKVAIAPASAQKKTYIIDEVHMLSRSAFNALLKTLEEPPSHAVFILATTDADKLPDTILSRVQRFNFQPVTAANIKRNLENICQTESIQIEEQALNTISHQARGSVRDSLSLLDQIRNLSDGLITASDVVNSLGLASVDAVKDLLAAAVKGDSAKVVASLTNLESSGVAASALADQLIATITDSAAEHPEYLPVLRELLDISKSRWPFASLLIALTSIVAPPNLVEVATPSATLDTTTSTNQKSKKSSSGEPAKPPKPSKPRPQPPKPTEGTSQQAAREDADFNWDDFITQVKAKTQGIFSLLSKSDHSLGAGKLEIFCGTKFAKTQIDRQKDVLVGILATSGLVDYEIETTASKKPPSDPKLAAALSILGGGEEVNL